MLEHESKQEHDYLVCLRSGKVHAHAFVIRMLKDTENVTCQIKLFESPSRAMAHMYEREKSIPRAFFCTHEGT